MGKVCPARITARQNIVGGAVSVNFSETHVGHDLDGTHMSFPASVKQRLVDELDQRKQPLIDQLQSIVERVRQFTTDDEFDVVARNIAPIGRELDALATSGAATFEMVLAARMSKMKWAKQKARRRLTGLRRKTSNVVEDAANELDNRVSVITTWPRVEQLVDNWTEHTFVQ